MIKATSVNRLAIINDEILTDRNPTLQSSSQSIIAS